MTSKETQPTTTTTDPSDKPSPKDNEIVSDSGDVEDPQAEDPQGEAKGSPTAQSSSMDAALGQPTESQVAENDDDDEEDEPEEEPEDGPTVPKWRVRGPADFRNSKGTPDKKKPILALEEKSKQPDPNKKSDPKSKSDTKKKT